MPTFYGLLEFPHPWPLSQTMRLLRTKHGDTILQIYGDHNGRMVVTISDLTGKEIKSLTTQRIIVTGTGFAAVVVRWDIGLCNLYLQFHEALADGAGVPPLPIALRGRPESELSVNNPMALVACKEWIDRRKSKFLRVPAKASPPSRRPKTAGEQAADLRCAILSMRHMKREAEIGNTFFVGDMAAQLRALLYWKNDDSPESTYNPLLLRMASMADLPLPIYLIKKDAVLPAQSDLAKHVKALVPGLTKNFPTEEIGDLQEWLRSTIVTIPKLGSPLSDKQAKEFIFQVAMTKGSSHYDPEISEFVEAMEKLESGIKDQLVTFICQTVDTIASLSDWVLSELIRLKVIS